MLRQKVQVCYFFKGTGYSTLIGSTVDLFKKATKCLNVVSTRCQWYLTFFVAADAAEKYVRACQWKVFFKKRLLERSTLHASPYPQILD